MVGHPLETSRTREPGTQVLHINNYYSRRCHITRGADLLEGNTCPPVSKLQQAGPHPFPSSLPPPPASPPLTSKLFLRDRISWTGESRTLPCSCSQAGDGSHHPGHQSPFPANTRVHGATHAIWGNVCPLHTLRALERPRALGGKLWPLDPEGILESIQLSRITEKTKAAGSQAAGLRRERRADPHCDLWMRQRLEPRNPNGKIWGEGPTGRRHPERLNMLPQPLRWPQSSHNRAGF